MMLRVTTAAAACGAAGVLAWAAPARAVLVPFTEEYPTGTSNWLNNASAAPTHVTTGGPNGAGDAYLSTSQTMSLASPDSFIVVYRGNGPNNASGGAFTGNWVSANVTEFSAWVRQDSGVNMTFGGRFASPVGGQAFVIGPSDPVPSGQWTKLTFAIDPSNPRAQGEALPVTPANWNTVFSNILNVQVFAYQGTLPSGTVVNLALDKPATVPEPASLGLLAGGCGLLLLRRRRQRRA